MTTKAQWFGGVCMGLAAGMTTVASTAEAAQNTANDRVITLDGVTYSRRGAVVLDGPAMSAGDPTTILGAVLNILPLKTKLSIAAAYKQWCTVAACTPLIGGATQGRTLDSKGSKALGTALSVPLGTTGVTASASGGATKTSEATLTVQFLTADLFNLTAIINSDETLRTKLKDFDKNKGKARLVIGVAVLAADASQIDSNTANAGLKVELPVASASAELSSSSSTTLGLLKGTVVGYKTGTIQWDKKTGMAKEITVNK